MEDFPKPKMTPNSVILQSENLAKYILETSVYPREPETLREIRNANASHPMGFMGASPDASQLMAILLKLLNAKKTIEVGVFTGYSLLLTALTIPDDGKYILETSVYPREPETLREIRNANASHPMGFMGASPDASQLMAILLKLLNAKKTIEVGVFTGYSLLLTALTIPDDGKIIAMDPDRKAYEIGLPFIKKAGVEHKIDFIESPALSVLDKLLEDPSNDGTFDFAFVDADKPNYWNYHERLLKLVKIGGLIIYDNTLWGGTVAWPEEDVPVPKRRVREATLVFNKAIADDSRVEISLASVGDGFTICRRAH